MRSLKLTLAYDGTAYAGWQKQPRCRTVQGMLEQALAKVTSERIVTVASGRTDAGVHALSQVVSLAAETSLAVDVLQRALNANLPEDIAVLEVAPAADGFHAIRDTRSKRYRYVIQDGGVRDVFGRLYAWHVYKPLCLEDMQEAAHVLRGTHDFASFQAAGSKRKTTVRTISHLSVERVAAELASRIYIEVEADGFLYNMVRNIVGTLVEIGRGERDVASMSQILAARNRTVAGMTAPPQGLFLIKVECCDP